MSHNPNIRSGGRVECDEAHGYYGEHVDPSSSTEFVGNPVLPQYMVTSDKEWVHPLSDVVYEDAYQFHDLRNMGQQLDYAEEVCLPTNAQTYMETGSNLHESLHVVANEVVINDMLWNAVETQQYVSAVHQDFAQQYLQSDVSQTGAPREIEAVLGTYGVHHIAHNSSSEWEVETNHSIQYDSRPVIMFEGPVNQSENALPPHHVQILRSKTKSQPCHSLHGELANRTIEPAIDPAVDRCLVSLDELCGPHFETTEHQRYVQWPTFHSHCEMADSTRKGESLYNWTGNGRQHGTRVSRIDRTTQFTTTSSQATSSTLQSSPLNSGLIRPPLLSNVSGTEVMRGPHLLIGNAVNTTASSIGCYDHAYHRNRSSEHRGAPTSNYHQAVKIGRPVARTVDANSVSGLDDGACTSERFLDNSALDSMSTSGFTTEIFDENQDSVHHLKKWSSSFINKGDSQCSDKNSYPRNVQGTLGSCATSTSKSEKQFTVVRDEYGRLRRFKRLQDGTLLTRNPSQNNLISQVGRITTETSVGTKRHRPRSPIAGTLWDVQSVAGKCGNIGGRRVGQWTRSQAFLTSWNPYISTSKCEGAHQRRNSNVAKRQKRSRRSVLLDRDPAVATRRGVQKAGRPLKRFRGRLAKQKQAIREAEISEKVAIRQRELPVLDLILKFIEDPTIELPLEATTFVDSSIIHDTSLLHEVGEALKDLVTQISLEELQPKRDIKSRSRRNWEHLSKRVRSKRQEYRKFNTPVDQRSPPPPPLRSKPKGRNSEKYRQAVLEQDKKQSGERATSNIPVLGSSPLRGSKLLNTSQEGVAETRDEGAEHVYRYSVYEQSSSLPSKSPTAFAANSGSG
ncbi:unnamed protein product [Angiostrongylus costaricensis]|uniref:YTH domain-containing protein n=1 Tax=Angiostrongylus costaricensis TaxID=334426 RepID=A0A0R3PZ77_ANGCS|nr:unnamed protein product [Angiostrongylus costaricensis]